MSVVCIMDNNSISPITSNFTFLMKDYPQNITFEEDSLALLALERSDFLLKTGDSTRSILAPLYEKDFESSQFSECNTSLSETNVHETQEVDPIILETREDDSIIHETQDWSEQNKSVTSNIRGISSDGEEDISLNTSFSKASSISNESVVKVQSDVRLWDEWMMKKAIEDMCKLKLKKEQMKEKSLERRKMLEDKERKLMLAKQSREEWEMRKDFEMKKKKKEMDAQEEFEKLKKAKDAEVLQVKSKERYFEWKEKKRKAEKHDRKQEKAKQRIEEEEKLNKQLKAAEEYKKWLSKNKSKQINERLSYGYLRGGLFGYYDMASNPTPSFTNPLPWTDVKPPPKCKNIMYSSPPMLWKDVERRTPASKSTRI